MKARLVKTLAGIGLAAVAIMAVPTPHASLGPGIWHFGFLNFNRYLLNTPHIRDVYRQNDKQHKEQHIPEMLIQHK